MSNSDRPTPPVNGTQNRWPIFRDLARKVTERARAYPAETDDKRLKLEALAKESAALALAFEMWEYGNVEPTLRQLAITRLLALRETGRELGLEVDAAPY